jgi:hypothetical protein
MADGSICRQIAVFYVVMGTFYVDLISWIPAPLEVTG